MQEFLYQLFPDSLLEAIARERQIPMEADLIPALIEKDQQDFWATQIINGLHSTTVEIRAYLYWQGYCHKEIPENFYKWQNSETTWSTYLKFWIQYGSFSSFPPVLEIPLTLTNSSLALARQMLLVKRIPTLEIDRLQNQELLRIVETGYIPEKLARRSARSLCLDQLLQRVEPEYQLEIIQALERIYTSVENYIRAETPNRWEQVLLRIDQFNSQQLASITRVIFPEDLPKSLEKYPAVWRHRIYLLRLMPTIDDPVGKRLCLD